METLLSFIMFFSFIGLIAGLIKPSLFARIFKTIPKRKIIALVFGGAMILSGFGSSAFNKPQSNTASIVSQQDNQAVEEKENDQEAPKEQVIEEANEVKKETGDTLAKTELKQTASAPQTQSQLVVEQTKPVVDLFSVVKVTDGDTIKVNINGTTEAIRLIGINTPETVDPRKPVECFGKEASNKAKELLTGKKVKLENDSSQGERDKYGRLLRYVYLEDGTFFNEKMIADGYASEYTYNTPYKYQAEFKQAEKEAKENKRGLWADDACLQDESQEAEQTPPPADSSGHTFYTSSYYTASFYYCDTDDGWKGLSSKYLHSFSSAEALLQVYPSRVLHEPCK